VRGDRRLSSFRAAGASDELSRAGAIGDQHGEQRRQGQITRSGSQHARRLLVEAAWHYRRPPRISRALERRQRGTHAAIIAISWKAQQRLHRLWRRLDVERGKRKTLVAVAIARHLAGFCWAIVCHHHESEQSHDRETHP
jgi:hypothetical protein